MTDATIIDVFQARATPAMRQSRPDIFRARMAWARRKIEIGDDEPRRAAGEGARPTPKLDPDARHLSLTRARGFALGDRVLVEVRPGVYLRGALNAWIREPAQTLAVVLLDGDAQLTRCGVWRLRRPGPDPLEPAA